MTSPPVVLRLVRRFLDRGQRVVLLSRRKAVRGYVNYTAAERRVTDGLDRFLGHVRSFLPEEDRERVSISTTHRYKGLEQDAVIILDGIEGSYPLIHPSWVFTRVFGDSFTEIEAAERRLFYVAVTRARESLVILSEARRPSPYLADIESRERLATIDWPELPAVSGPGDPRVDAARHGDRGALRAVEALTHSAADVQLTGEGTTIQLPDALRVVLELASRELLRGNRVSLLPVERMLTTREAAELLNVSRPYLIRLLEGGRIPDEMVGTHRRISVEDALRFRAERSADRRRVLRDLSQEADELGIYEE